MTIDKDKESGVTEKTSAGDKRDESPEQVGETKTDAEPGKLDDSKEQPQPAEASVTPEKESEAAKSGESSQPVRGIDPKYEKNNEHRSAATQTAPTNEKLDLSETQTQKATIQAAPDRTPESKFYLGFFSFEALDLWNKKIFGHFCCIADAKSPDEAIEKFEALILNPRMNGSAFSVNQKETTSVQIDGLIEVEKIPPKGSLVYIHDFYQADLMGGIFGTVPGGEDGLTAFDREFKEGEEVPPFLTF
jgi:hypothetical protein